MPNITLEHCIILNLATLLPTEDDGEPHDIGKNMATQKIFDQLWNTHSTSPASV